jgi:acetyltransferase-like isoleucine patch superfamily enzyme
MRVTLLAIIKRIFWDLKDPIGRFNVLAAMFANYPGKAGTGIRERIYRNQFASMGEGVIIHAGLRVRNVHKITVGDHSELGVDCFLQGGGGITLGKRVLLGPGTKIWSINHTIDNIEIPITEQGYTREAVSIGDGCWLGANVFIFPGVVLPEGCVVSAGSVVGKKRYPAYAIIGGYPARVIGTRKPKEPTED